MVKSTFNIPFGTFLVTGDVVFRAVLIPRACNAFFFLLYLTCHEETRPKTKGWPLISFTRLHRQCRPCNSDGLPTSVLPTYNPLEPRPLPSECLRKPSVRVLAMMREESPEGLCAVVGCGKN